MADIHDRGHSRNSGQQSMAEPMAKALAEVRD